MYISQNNYLKSVTQYVTCVWPNHYFYWEIDFPLKKSKDFNINYCYRTYEIQCGWNEENLINLYNLLCPWKIQTLLEAESIRSLNSYSSHHFSSKASQCTMQQASAMNYHWTLLIALSQSISFAMCLQKHDDFENSWISL